MKSILIPLQLHRNPAKKAVAPIKGAAAFSRSTGTKCLPRKKCFPAISQRQIRNSVESNNLLPETHYFRRRLAEHPIPNVVLTEGQRTSLGLLREVAA